MINITVKNRRKREYIFITSNISQLMVDQLIQRTNCSERYHLIGFTLNGFTKLEISVCKCHFILLSIYENKSHLSRLSTIFQKEGYKIR